MTNQLSATTTSSATSPITQRFAQKLLTPSVLCPLALLLLVAVLWIPFGLNVGFTTDDWHFFGEVDQGGTISVPLRPFTTVPWRIAGAISPESFAGANLLLLGMLFLKVLLVFQIIRILGVPILLAFASSALIAVYPADTGIFWISTLNLNFAIVNLLIAIWALLRFWNYGKLTSAIIMWMALSLALGTYEPTFIFAAAAPALLLLQNRRMSWRLVRVSAMWYAVPVLFGVRYAYVVLTQPSAAGYQEKLFDLPVPFGELVRSAEIIIRRHFLDGWLSCDSPLNPGYLLLALVSAGVVFALLLYLWHRSTAAERDIHRRLYWLMAALGLAVMILGLIPYLVTGLRDQTLRTYYYSTIGAALIVVSLLGWLLLGKSGRIRLFAAGVAVLTLLGTYSLLLQHAAWADWSLRQQQAAAGLVHVLGAVEPATAVIMVDESADKNARTAYDGSWFLTNILNILYRDYSLRGVFCEPDTVQPWGSMMEGCQFTADGLVFTLRDVPMYQATYDSIVLVRHLGDNQYVIEPDLSRLGVTSDAYDPFRLIDPSAAPPERLRTLFGIEAGG